MTPRKLSTLLALSLLAGCTPNADDEFPAPDSTPRAAVPLAAQQLKLMTWNVAFMEFEVHWVLPVPGGITVRPQSGYSDLSYEERAEEIADSILRADADVVVLNEVFSDKIREILVDRLQADYPHFVSKLKSDAVVEEYLGPFPNIDKLLPDGVSAYAAPPIGSGLMLFSRVPFLELDAGIDQTCGASDCLAEGVNDGQQLSDSEVAFMRFDDCSGIDCMASKGVGIVKLDTPVPSHVVFTHMQADDENADVREGQLSTISSLMMDAAGQFGVEDLPLFLSGDFNIKGGSAEWAARFSPTQVQGDPFFACGNGQPCDLQTGRLMTDIWGFGTSPADLGQTSQGGSRLDYIFHGRPADPQCMQHAKIPWDAMKDGVRWFSDHRAVTGEFATSAQWCSPNRANPAVSARPNVLQFGELDCDNGDTDPTNDCIQDLVYGPPQGAMISNPGNVQWYVIDQPGAYSMDVEALTNEVDFAFDVYREDDLSRPLAPFNEGNKHPEFGWTFPMTDGDYYIRVYPVTEGQRNRTVSNVPYELRVHQHLCRDPADACPVYPAMKIPAPWPDSTTSTEPVEELFYRFKTSSVADGRLMPPTESVFFPEIDFMLETPFSTAECFDEPQVQVYDDPQIPQDLKSKLPFDGKKVDTDKDFDDNGEYDERWRAPTLGGVVKDELAEYFVRIPRSCTEAMDSSIRYETTLTYFEPGRMVCDEQAQDSGVGEDDDIRIDFTFDKPGGGSTPGCESSCDYYGEYDEAWPSGLQQPGQDELQPHAALRGWYVDRFYPNVFESQGDAQDPDQRLNVQFASPDAWESPGLPPLSPVVPEQGGAFVFGDDADCNSNKDPIGDEDCDPDYWYDMSYARNHRGDQYKK